MTEGLLTGRAWRAHRDEVIDRERAAMGGLGPFERQRLMEKAPESVHRLLRQAAERPEIRNVQSNFTGPTGQPSGSIASFTPVASTNSETNLWVPAIWTPIPANDMQGGKVYKIECGGVMSSSSGAGAGRTRILTV